MLVSPIIITSYRSLDLLGAGVLATWLLLVVQVIGMLPSGRGVIHSRIHIDERDGEDDSTVGPL